MRLILRFTLVLFGASIVLMVGMLMVRRANAPENVWLAYNVDKSLYRMNEQTRVVSKVMDYGSDFVTDNAVSLDRTWLLFGQREGQNRYASNLYLVNLGGVKHQLTNLPGREEFQTFVSPSVFYFVSALMLCIIMLVPSYKPLILGGILLVCGGEGFYRMMGFVRAIVHAARQHQDFDITEWLTQAILPAASYTFILIAGGSFALQQYKLAFTLAALVTSLLLLSAIGNTWSLVLWIIEQRRD